MDLVVQFIMVNGEVINASSLSHRIYFPITRPAKRINSLGNDEKPMNNTFCFSGHFLIPFMVVIIQQDKLISKCIDWE